MKLIAWTVAGVLLAGPALANKLHQESPTASEVKAWKADQDKIKKQGTHKKQQHRKKSASGTKHQVKETVGGHEHNK
ncbi:hypothetical protein DBR44_16135 [Aquitalea sp. FJL05]|uniref:hypothetical protein n=1 Tax=Aquitalea sp. FJL05 TaxID=2153366 RepID=UPI000F59ABE8|nr:hypothetical protein [Aquitalea sp. FJL05]RQO68205.1 hypothetical protein DBR44_16135 [Aquitalea sp. FJL05]